MTGFGLMRLTAAIVQTNGGSVPMLTNLVAIVSVAVALGALVGGSMDLLADAIGGDEQPPEA